MPDPHCHPPLVITNLLVITVITVSCVHDAVRLEGFYGDATGGDTYRLVEITCSFDQLNTLLSELAQESWGNFAQDAEAVIDELAGVLTRPGSEEHTLDLSESDPLEFYEHVFSLSLREQKDDLCSEAKPPSYELRGATRRKVGWPLWPDAWGVATEEERAAYLAHLLVLRFGLYLAYWDKRERAEALAIAGLTDLTVFALARVQYELLQKEVSERPEEYE